MVTVKDIADLQAGYARLTRNSSLSKKAMCDLCIPFKEKSGLPDSKVLAIARKEIDLKKILEICPVYGGDGVVAKPVALDYGELKDLFRFREQHNVIAKRADPTYAPQHLSAHIVFTEDSFDDLYPIESRTYIISSNNKAYCPNMGGYSIFGSCLDGKDPCVRLDQYMAAEKGGDNGWKIEACYLVG